jgi:hypothetical protein
LLSVLAVEESLNLGAVAWVNAEEGQSLAHADFGHVELDVEVVPELFFNWLRSLGLEFNRVQAESSPHAFGGFKTVIALEVVQLALVGQDKQIERWSLRESDESVEGGRIGISDFTGLDSISNGVLENVLSVVLPDTLKVGLVGDEGGHLVGVDEVLFLHQLGSHFAKGVVFSFKLFAAFLSSRVDAENELGFLVGVGKAVQLFESFLLVVGVFEKMAASSPPGRLGNFVIEETG